MQFAKLYWLEGKDYFPIIVEIETNPQKETLLQAIAIYFRSPFRYLILAMTETVGSIVERHGAIEILADVAKADAYDNTYTEFALYGKKDLLDTTVPDFTVTKLLLDLPLPSKS